jgi:hypothetical protein
MGRHFIWKTPSILVISFTAVLSSFLVCTGLVLNADVKVTNKKTAIACITLGSFNLTCYLIYGVVCVYRYFARKYQKELERDVIDFVPDIEYTDHAVIMEPNKDIELK